MLPIYFIKTGVRGGGKLCKINELFRFLVELEQDPSSTEEDKKTIDSILESIRTRKGLAKKDLSKISHIKKNQVINDLEKESEDNLKRGEKPLPVWKSCISAPMITAVRCGRSWVSDRNWEPSYSGIF